MKVTDVKMRATLSLLSKHSRGLREVLVEADDTLRLTVTNEDNYMRVVVDEAYIRERGRCVLPMMRFSPFCVAHDAVNLTLEKNRLTVVSGFSQLKLQTQSVDAFPSLEIKGESVGVISSDVLLDAIGRVEYAMSKDTVMFECVHFDFDTCNVVTSNNGRVTPIYPIDGLTGTTSISRYGLSGVKDFLKHVGGDVRLYLSESAMWIESGENLLRANVPAYSFPDYKALKQGDDIVRAAVAPDEMQKVLGAAVAVLGSNATIMIKFATPVLHINAEVEGVAFSDACACEADGEITVKINPKYLLDAVSKYDAEYSISVEKRSLLLEAERQRTLLGCIVLAEDKHESGESST